MKTIKVVNESKQAVPAGGSVIEPGSSADLPVSVVTAALAKLRRSEVTIGVTICDMEECTPECGPEEVKKPEPVAKPAPAPAIEPEPAVEEKAEPVIVAEPEPVAEEKPEPSQKGRRRGRPSKNK